MLKGAGVFFSLLLGIAAPVAADIFSNIDSDALCKLAPKHLQRAYTQLEVSARLGEVYERTRELLRLQMLAGKDGAHKLRKCQSDLSLAIESHLKILQSKVQVSPYELAMLEADYQFALGNYEQAASLYLQAGRAKPKDKDAAIKEIAAIFSLIEQRSLSTDRLRHYKRVVKGRLQELQAAKNPEVSAKAALILAKWNVAI